MVNELPSIRGVAMVSVLQYLRHGTFFWSCNQRTCELLHPVSFAFFGLVPYYSPLMPPIYKTRLR